MIRICLVDGLNLRLYLIYNKFSDLINLNKRIEKDEKEILDKEFYKKKYEKFLKEKELSDKEKTGYTKTGSDTVEKATQNTEEIKVKLLNRNKSPSRSVNKTIGDNNKKKTRKIKDKYESKFLKNLHIKNRFIHLF